jgi:undecaprenyl-diphosphatase
MARDSAARFAFLLAIPALAGAALVQLPELGDTSLGLGAGAAGFVASLVSSYVAVAGLLRYLRNRTLYPFAAYCVVAAPTFYLLVN